MRLEQTTDPTVQEVYADDGYPVRLRLGRVVKYGDGTWHIELWYRDTWQHIGSGHQSALAAACSLAQSYNDIQAARKTA